MVGHYTTKGILLKKTKTNTACTLRVLFNTEKHAQKTLDLYTNKLPKNNNSTQTSQISLSLSPSESMDIISPSSSSTSSPNNVNKQVHTVIQKHLKSFHLAPFREYTHVFGCIGPISTASSIDEVRKIVNNYAQHCQIAPAVKRNHPRTKKNNKYTSFQFMIPLRFFPQLLNLPQFPHANSKPAVRLSLSINQRYCFNCFENGHLKHACPLSNTTCSICNCHMDKGLIATHKKEHTAEEIQNATCIICKGKHHVIKCSKFVARYTDPITFSNYHKYTSEYKRKTTNNAEEFNSQTMSQLLNNNDINNVAQSTEIIKRLEAEINKLKAVVAEKNAVIMQLERGKYTANKSKSSSSKKRKKNHEYYAQEQQESPVSSPSSSPSTVKQSSTGSTSNNSAASVSPGLITSPARRVKRTASLHPLPVNHIDGNSSDDNDDNNDNSHTSTNIPKSSSYAAAAARSAGKDITVQAVLSTHAKRTNNTNNKHLLNTNAKQNNISTRARRCSTGTVVIHA